jgi:hypothetical protein
MGRRQFWRPYKETNIMLINTRNLGGSGHMPLLAGFHLNPISAQIHEPLPNPSLDQAIRTAASLFRRTTARERAAQIKNGTREPRTTQQLVVRGNEILRRAKVMQAKDARPPARRRPRIVTITLPIA